MDRAPRTIEVTRIFALFFCFEFSSSEMTNRISSSISTSSIIRGGINAYLTVFASSSETSYVLYCTVEYSTVHYCTEDPQCLRRYRDVLRSTVLYCGVQYSTVQYCTVEYSTAQYSTVLWSTVQYSTVLRILSVSAGLVTSCASSSGRL